MLALARKN